MYGDEMLIIRVLAPPTYSPPTYETLMNIFTYGFAPPGKAAATPGPGHARPSKAAGTPGEVQEWERRP